MILDSGLLFWAALYYTHSNKVSRFTVNFIPTTCFTEYAVNKQVSLLKRTLVMYAKSMTIKHYHVSAVF